jgi:hypothetical protein
MKYLLWIVAIVFPIVFAIASIYKLQTLREIALAAGFFIVGYVIGSK